MKSDANRFLSTKGLLKLGARKKTQKTIGWILTLFFGFAVVASLTAGPEEQSLREGLSVYICGLIPSVFLLWCGYRSAARFTAAERYAAVFAADSDGQVTAEELTKASGKSADQVLKELNTLFNLGLFQSCVLEKGGPGPRVVISDAQLDRSVAGFVNVKCPNCGGTTRIRYGVVGKCDWCGSPLRGVDRPVG